MENSEIIRALVEDEKVKFDGIWNAIKNYFELELQSAKGAGLLYSNLAAAELTSIELLPADLENYDYVTGLEKRCTKSEFFIALTDEIRKNGVWAQKKFFNLTKV